jgi:hypothetical protein
MASSARERRGGSGKTDIWMVKRGKAAPTAERIIVLAARLQRENARRVRGCFTEG